MDTIKDTRHSQRGGPIVTEVSVPSFSLKDVSYIVKLYHGAEGNFLGASCECGAYVRGPGCTKHVCEARTRRLAESKGAPAHHAEYIHELCKRVFAKPRKGESAARSYDLLLEVYGYRYRTPELEAAAYARHDVVTGRIYGDGSRAA